MNLLDKIGREFSGYNLLESGKRLFDRKPLQCSLYLTDRCNLDCSYCTEYDNSKPHPKLEDLKLWIRKIRDLGTMRIALVGGEPLAASGRGRDRPLLPRTRLRHQPNDQWFSPHAQTAEGAGRSRPSGDANQRRSDDAEPGHEEIVQDDFAEARLLQGFQNQPAHHRRDLRRTRCRNRRRCWRPDCRAAFRPRCAWCTPIRSAAFAWHAARRKNSRSLSIR